MSASLRNRIGSGMLSRIREWELLLPESDLLICPSSGVTGLVQLDENGDREMDFALWDLMDSNGSIYQVNSAEPERFWISVGFSRVMLKIHPPVWTLIQSGSCSRTRFSFLWINP